MPLPTIHNESLHAFIEHKIKIDGLLDRLKAQSHEHFGIAPDDVNWGHVGMLAECAALLQRVTEMVTRNQDPRSSK